jgi:WD40 repeat protein
LWDVRSRVPVATREHAAGGPIMSVAVSPKGDVATAGSDGVVRTWSVRDLSDPLATTARVPTNVNAVLFTRSGELVTANGDGTVRFWRPDGSEARPPLSVDPDGDVVFSVAVSPDETELAAATATDDVTLWDLASRRLRAELNGQPPDPLSVAFTRDGDALATANRQGIVTLWNARTGESIGHRFDNHGSRAVWRVESAADNVIVSAGEDGTLTTLDALDIRRACELGAGSFDRLARARYIGDREPEGCVH